MESKKELAVYLPWNEKNPPKADYSGTGCQSFRLQVVTIEEVEDALTVSAMLR